MVTKDAFFMRICQIWVRALVLIEEQNTRLAWFNDFIPNTTVFQRLADEILQTSSIQGR